ncbi:MAG: TIGR04211 family SH3 domain-containing protein [Proteobacteria bacterium]|nr:MAG: TIGR04211 family SH3 domain-containing protein [Pseudomonadota bacterium]
MHRFLLPLLLLVAAHANATTMYISDELAVPLRRGPSNGHRILHAGLPSGMKLEVLGEDREAGFTHVRTPNGTEGWVPTQYLVATPIAKDRLAAATKRIADLEAQLKKLRESSQETRAAQTAAETRNKELEQQARELAAELADVRRVAADPLAQAEENQKLKAENQQMLTRLKELSEEVQELERDVQLRWLLAGGGLVLIGLILGVWLKSRSKRSTWA